MKVLLQFVLIQICLKNIAAKESFGDQIVYRTPCCSPIKYVPDAYKKTVSTILFVFFLFKLVPSKIIIYCPSNFLQKISSMVSRL